MLLAAATDEAALAFVEIGALILGLALLARLAERFGLTAIPLYLVAGLAIRALRHDEPRPGDPTPDWSGTQADIIRADLTFFETAGGGAVFSTGSIAWAGSMAWNGYDNEIARMTSNVLRRFNDPETFRMPEARDGEG